MSVVIQVKDLSKQYRLGSIGTGSLAHDINRWWYRLRGKEDPYLKVGDENERNSLGGSEYVWALKDVSFDVKHGEVLGIIGRNGAGKSTLLKILSRTTKPTTGSAKLRGRVASLLEVGTGFHPELTGRENIFLNGAILGMTKQEIRKKFDEIVSFAGIERYTDTPVKRYSSGMYVRLAFAVAAHLDPEILIVDEVLAVGDAEFQRKCLGKMKEVSTNEGRTILFVSHNLTAVKSLCDSVLYMRNGSPVELGPASQVINNYLSHQVNSSMLQKFDDLGKAPGNNRAKLKRIEVCPQLTNPEDPVTIKTPINIEVEFYNNVSDKSINLTLFVNTISEECVFATATNAIKLPVGLNRASCRIPGEFMNDNIYNVSLMIVGDSQPICFFENIVSFELNESRKESGWHGKWPGIIRPTLDFNFVR